MSDVKDRLRKFIDDEVLFGEGTVTDDQDSAGRRAGLAGAPAVRRAHRVGVRLEVGDADMVPDNFRTLNAVETYIAARSS